MQANYNEVANMPAPTAKQRRAAKQGDSLGWVRNAKKSKVQLFEGAHIQHIGSGKLGTVLEIFSGDDGMTRAKVRHFNGELWDWNPPVSLIEVV